jgi:hypothetical protein
MRTSSRQQELQARKEQERLAAEAEAALERERDAEARRALYAQLLDLVPAEQEDFDLPAEMKPSEKRSARAFRSKAGLPDGVPPYRTLKRNLYKPPMFRPQPAEGDDIAVCSCTPGGGCGPSCQNRCLYMECVPGHCPSCVISAFADSEGGGGGGGGGGERHRR